MSFVRIMKRRKPLAISGFTLIELMVTITLLGLMMALAMPSLSTWIRNSQVRATGDTLQNGLRLAQAEALRRSRQIVFSLTDSPTPQTSLSAKENGKYWSINVVPVAGLDTYASAADQLDRTFIQSGVLDISGSEVSIEGPAAICFSSLGRMAVNSSPGVSDANCSGDDIPASYKLSLTGADRNLRVDVAVGGQVRMCDPNKTLSATHPDGC